MVISGHDFYGYRLPKHHSILRFNLYTNLTKLIKLSDSTYDRLAEHGKWADSMDDIVKRLIKEADRASRSHTASEEQLEK